MDSNGHSDHSELMLHAKSEKFSSGSMSPDQHRTDERAPYLDLVSNFRTGRGW